MFNSRKNTIRTPIEQLFLSEMVEEDAVMIALGECNDTVLDNLLIDNKNNISIFDSTSSYENDIDNIFDYDDDLFDY